MVKGNGKGKGSAKGKHPLLKKHYRKQTKAIEGISKPSFRRLARRGGVKRISEDVYHASRDLVQRFVDDVVRDAVIFTEHSKRKTISTQDVLMALKNRGNTLYGFN